MYYVQGSIERAGGGPLEGFTIVLMVKGKQYDGPTDWKRIGTPDITDEQGRFQVQSGELYYDVGVDSLAPAMVNPDTVLVGIPFPASESERFPIEPLHSHVEDGFFCDDIESSWKVDGYEYDYRNKLVPLP